MTEHPQSGIFAQGTVEHGYLELDLAPGRRPAALVATLATLCGPEPPVVGVGAVVGLRPELWAQLAPGDSPPGPRSFEPVEGEGLTMPATQHDGWVWLAGGSRDAVFDATRIAIDALDGVATVATEVRGWVYRHDRDLTGFIDGTENPSALEAPSVAVVGSGSGAGSSVVLVQRWRHLDTWRSLAVEEQEKVIGRTKADSTELGASVMPEDSHVSRTTYVVDGEERDIYRRNTAYGGPTEHGTVFVGFCASRDTLQAMLERMAGVGDGVRDALTRYATPLTGGYYLCPSSPALARFLPTT